MSQSLLPKGMMSIFTHKTHSDPPESLLGYLFQVLVPAHVAQFLKAEYSYTSKTALMHPSFSGLFVTWAYLPKMKEKKNKKHLFIFTKLLKQELFL